MPHPIKRPPNSLIRLLPWIDQFAASATYFGALAIPAISLNSQAMVPVASLMTAIGLAQLLATSMVGVPSTILLRQRSLQHAQFLEGISVLSVAVCGLAPALLLTTFLALTDAVELPQLAILGLTTLLGGRFESHRRLLHAQLEWHRVALRSCLMFTAFSVGSLAAWCYGYSASIAIYPLLLGFLVGSVPLRLRPTKRTAYGWAASLGSARYAAVVIYQIAAITVASSVLFWCWSQGIPLLLEPALGSSAFVGMRLALSMTSPISLILQPMETKWLARYADTNQNERTDSLVKILRTDVRRICRAAAGGIAVYAALTLTFSLTVLSRHPELPTFIVGFCAYQYLLAIAKPYVAAIRARHEYHSIVRAQLIGLIVFACLALVAMVAVKQTYFLALIFPSVAAAQLLYFRTKARLIFD